MTSSSSKVSYLVGTVHVHNDYTKYWLAQSRMLLDRVNRYFAETDLDLLEKSSFPVVLNNWSLNQAIGANRYERARRHFLKILSFDISKYNNIHPFWLNSAILVHVMNGNGKMSMDQHLWKEAKKIDLQTYGIESIGKQLSIFNEISPESQVRDFKIIAKNISQFRKNSLDILRLYQEGKVHRLFQLSKQKLRKLKKLMLYDRNVNMAEEIKKVVEEDSCLFAIGAAHLCGEKGVIRLLKKNALIVEPVLNI